MLWSRGAPVRLQMRATRVHVLSEDPRIDWIGNGPTV